MSKEPDTFLTALYVLIDDHVVPPRAGRGRQPLLSDSELITLAVAQVMLGQSPRTSLDPAPTQQPRVAQDVPVLAQPVGLPHAIDQRAALAGQSDLALAACCPSWFDELWMTDATLVPCGMSRETVTRSDLAGHASYNACASIPAGTGG